MYEKRKNLRVARVAIVCISTVLALAGSASAANLTAPVTLRPSDATGNTVTGPGYYDIESRPGGVTRLYAVVANPGRTRVRVRVAPVDARSGEYGAVSYDLPAQPRRQVGRWIRLQRGVLPLNARQGAVVPFLVRVPRRVSGGQYVGGLSAYVPSSVRRITRGMGLRVQTRVVDAVVVTIPGQMRASLRPVQVVATYRSNDLYAIVRIRNTGNLLLKGTGNLWLYAPHARRPWIHRAFPIDTTVPRTTVNYPVRWAHRVRPGTYRFVARLDWRAGTHQTPGRTPIRWQGGRARMQGVVRVR